MAAAYFEVSIGCRCHPIVPRWLPSQTVVIKVPASAIREFAILNAPHLMTARVQDDPAEPDRFVSLEEVFGDR